jgi:hypothetical protein
MQGPRVIVDICYNREIVTSGMAMGHHELEQILCSTSEDARIGGAQDTSLSSSWKKTFKD